MERSHTLDVGEPDAFDLLFFIRRRATRLPIRIAKALERVVVMFSQWVLLTGQGGGCIRVTTFSHWSAWVMMLLDILLALY